MLKKLRSFMKDLTIADVITWTGILVVGLLLFAAVLSLEGCISSKYKDCSYERTKTVETELICDDGKEAGTVILPSSPY